MTKIHLINNKTVFTIKNTTMEEDSIGISFVMDGKALFIPYSSILYMTVEI